jgi:hypothetical protein
MKIIINSIFSVVVILVFSLFILFIFLVVKDVHRTENTNLYKLGQIAALNEKLIYELKENLDKTITWHISNNNYECAPYIEKFYKQGFVDAKTGKIKYKLIDNLDESMMWEEIK